MFLRGAVLCGISLALLAHGQDPPRAQKAAPMIAYTVTETNSLFGPPALLKISRLGSKVLVEQSAADSPSTSTRTIHDLDKHKSFTVSSTGCSAATFSGDWGDPFAALDELTGPEAKQLGTEIILGYTANIVEAATPAATIRAWVDAKSGLVLKVQISQADRALRTVIEVTAVSFDPPPASLFVVPPDCAAAPPTEDERLAALTGGHPGDFAQAIYASGSKDSCALQFRVVRARTMEPINSGFQVGVDLDSVTEATPSYVIGMSQSGHATFSGGGLHEVTSQMRNGVLRMDNIPAQFEMDLEFGAAGAASATLYRQCFAPRTVLLFVVNNPARLSDGGEWLWVKSGQFAKIEP